MINRLTAISTTSGSTGFGFGYQHNDANQRTRVDLGDGSYWEYNYDNLGQVTAGSKHWSDGTAVAGQQFGYGYDTIGNRTASVRDTRTTTYNANTLNQYTNRFSPGYVNVVGEAVTNATVTVNWETTERKGKYYRREVGVTNSNPVWLSVTNMAVVNDGTNPDIVAEPVGKLYIAPNSESYVYDRDGNRTNDARWNYVWDAENRLIRQETTTYAATNGVPQEKVEYGYDYRSRRISKKSYSGWNGSTYTSTTEKRFVYDGWNVIAEFSVPSGLLLDKSYVWGLDVSLSLQGAGGVAGLVSMTETGGNTSHFYAFDGNGNVAGLISASSGDETARYEYGPFGEVIRQTGAMALSNPYRFSTKYQDDETSLLYYGYRYYEPETGRWLSRDPIEENGGLNVYGFVGNYPIGAIDVLGLMDRPYWLYSAYWGSLGQSAYETCSEMKAGAGVLTSWTGTKQAYGQMQEDTSDRYARMMLNYGEGQTYVIAANDVVGTTMLGEAAFNVDLEYQQELTPLERKQRALIGGGQTLLSITGGAQMLNRARTPFFWTAAQEVEAAAKLRAVQGMGFNSMDEYMAAWNKGAASEASCPAKHTGQAASASRDCVACTAHMLVDALKIDGISLDTLYDYVNNNSTGRWLESARLMEDYGRMKMGHSVFWNQAPPGQYAVFIETGGGNMHAMYGYVPPETPNLFKYIIDGQIGVTYSGPMLDQFDNAIAVPFTAR